MIKIKHSGTAIYPAGATFGPRLLRDYEFVWIMRGSAVAYFDEERIEAGPDTLLLGTPGTTDRYQWDLKSRTVHAFVHFEIRGDSSAAWPRQRLLAKDDLLKSLFHFCLKNGNGALSQQCLRLMLDLFKAGRGGLALTVPEAYPPALERAFEFVRDSMHRPVAEYPQPAAIASASHVSIEHLTRLFKRHINMGPAEYVRLLRLDTAARLIERSNLNVTEIADSVGYSNPYQFSKTFKAVYGLSPAHYRTAALAGKLRTSNSAAKVLRNLPAI